MTKNFALAIFVVLLFAFVQKAKENEAQTKFLEENDANIDVYGSYSINIAAEDYGAGVNKAILSLNTVIDFVGQGSFYVQETKSAFGTLMTLDRRVLNVYLCDQNGNRVLTSSTFIAIELGIGPTEGSPICWESKYLYF